MSSRTNRKVLLNFCAVLAVVLITVATASSADVKTTKLSGTVVSVEGNNLIVKMSTGDVKVFTPQPDRKFIIDGKELTLAELQPGTKLNATITESTSTVMNKTVENLQGTVLYAAGPNVVLVLASGEARKYFVGKDHPAQFKDSNGKDITVFDLRKGMEVTATKITEAPVDVISTESVVTGSAPQVAQAPASKPAPEPEPASAPAPAPAPAAKAPVMPKTGTSLPLIAQLGFAFIVIAFAIRKFGL
jgi:hypothetical protein